MSNFERTTSWQQIQQGVKDIERLLERNDYNLVMVKARQVLEWMVRCMAEGSCLLEGDLSDTIDQLYEGRIISRATRDNCHTIRILGNKAVHEGDKTPYDADTAYKLLTKEIYVLANEFQRRSPATDRRTKSGVSHGAYVNGRSSAGIRSSPGRRSSGQRSSPVRSTSGGRRGATFTGGRSSYHGSPRQGPVRRKKRRRVSPMFYMWRLLIPILGIILLIVIIKIFAPGKDKKPDLTSTSPTETTAVIESTSPLIPEPTTIPETDPVLSVYKIKGSGVNVRSAPSTDVNSTVLVQLPNNTEVEYVKRYNDEWAVINYDGKEAYVSNQFLERTDLVAGSQESESGAQQ